MSWHASWPRSCCGRGYLVSELKGNHYFCMNRLSHNGVRRRHYRGVDRGDATARGVMVTGGEGEVLARQESELHADYTATEQAVKVGVVTVQESKRCIKTLWDLRINHSGVWKSFRRLLTSVLLKERMDEWLAWKEVSNENIYSGSLNA